VTTDTGAYTHNGSQAQPLSRILIMTGKKKLAVLASRVSKDFLPATLPHCKPVLDFGVDRIIKQTHIRKQDKLSH